MAEATGYTKDGADEKFSAKHVYISSGLPFWNRTQIADVDFDLGSDHAAAIKSTLDVLNDLGGGKLILPPRIYNIEEPIDLGVGHALIQIEGFLPGSTYGAGDDRGSILRATGNFNVIQGFWDNCAFKNFRVDANNQGGKGFEGAFSKTLFETLEIYQYVGAGLHIGAGGTANGDNLTYLNKVRDVTLNAEDGWGAGIDIEWRCADSWIVECNIGSRGPNIRSTASTLRIMQNHLNGVEGGGPEHNLEILGNSALQIVANLMEHARFEAVVYERPSWETGPVPLALILNDNMIRDASYADDGDYSAVRITGNSGANPTATVLGLTANGNHIYNPGGTLIKNGMELERVTGIDITGGAWSEMGSDSVHMTDCLDYVVNGHDYVAV